MVSVMVFFVLSIFPRDVLDEILDLTESVSEGFSTQSSILMLLFLCCVEILVLSPYIHLMLLLYQSFGTVYPIIF